MHVGKEFLIEAVSLSLLVALIIISMQMFERTVKISSLLEQSQEKMISEMEEYEIVKYEDCLVDGMTVINYIKKMISIYHLPVHVTTDQEEFCVSEYADYTDLIKSDSEKYIRPLAKYRCRVIRDENGTITEIRMEAEKEGDL